MDITDEPGLNTDGKQRKRAITCEPHPVEYKFIQNHFHPKRENFIQHHFHPKPVSSQNHFHPKTTLIQNQFHPMCSGEEGGVVGGGEWSMWVRSRFRRSGVGAVRGGGGPGGGGPGWAVRVGAVLEKSGAGGPGLGGSVL